MRILILANSDEGLIQFRKELLERLIANKHQVFVSVPSEDYCDEIKAIGCEVIDTNINRRGINPIVDFKLMLDYFSILNKTKPDIVFTYTIKPNVYGGSACSVLKIPYVANITGLGTAVENGGVLQKIAIILYKIGLRNVQTVFFQNKMNQEFFLKNKIAVGKNKLIPGSGVNTDKFELSEYPKETIEFLYVGRLMKEKGIDQYLDAAICIKEKYPNVKFHICGTYEEDYKDTMEKLINDNMVVYHGSVKKMLDIYKNISCTIHPTYYPEGMSNVLLESLSVGRPIITTKRPGTEEIIEDGVNGFVVKQQNSNDLIEKVEKFINLTFDERKQMGINGRNKVEREFDRNIVVDKYLKEIECVS